MGTGWCAQGAGVSVKIIAPEVGGAKLANGSIQSIDGQLAGTPSVLADAIAIILSDKSTKELPMQSAAIDFVRYAFGHIEEIAIDNCGQELLETAKVGKQDHDDDQLARAGGGCTKTRNLLVALTAVALTITVGVVALNFSGSEKKIGRTLTRLYSADDPQFRNVMGVLLGPALIDGNRFDTLLNGDQIFPAMLSSIRHAETSISFESYIYWSGSIGREFAEALSERARAGIKVHVLLDWLGSDKLDSAQLRMMEDAGVKLRKFHEPLWYHLHRMNNRTHRKLLIVDGKVGFTGGVGIADVWTGNAEDPEHWRDTHFRAEGPVVAQMQAVFMDNWIKVTGEVLHGIDYFPALPISGGSTGQMFSSSPEGGSESMRLMYLLAITAATRSIHLSSAYFVPDDLTMKTLVAAARRGVRIRIVTPGAHMDAATVRRASRARWGELLEAGVEIFEYQPTMYHCKVMIVDELWVSVGSTNFDNRSFSLNDEANLNIFDAAFAKRQIENFQHDVVRSKAMTFSQWQRRPWVEKIVENAASLLRLQL